MIIHQQQDLLIYNDNVYGVADGWRSCTIAVNPASFGCAVNCIAYYYAIYTGKNFNVEPPTLPGYQSVLYDKIAHLEHVESECVQLTPDEQQVANHLNYGIDVDEFARNQPQNCPQGFVNANKLKRVSYKLPLFEMPRPYLLHPKQRRPLSSAELNVLGDFTTINNWLIRQVELFNANAWGESDYYSTFNPTKQMWDGEWCIGAKHKTFNLVRYVPPIPHGSTFDDSLCLREFEVYFKKGRTRNDYC